MTAGHIRTPGRPRLRPRVGALAAAIEQARRDRRLTFEQLGERMDVDASTACRWCDGSLMPSTAHFWQLMEVLQVELPDRLRWVQLAGEAVTV